jgi:hypothetical protein
VVKFDNNKQLEIRQANLIANGTVTDSITFTSNAGSPYSGIWSGFYFNNATVQHYHSQFNFCNFQYANRGFYTWTDYDTIDIKNSSFLYNTSGIWFTNETSIFIDSCSFQYNTYGINSTTYRIVMSNSIIINNQYGILSSENSTYTHCIINNNSIKGLATAQDVSVIDCEIKNNGIGLEIGPSGAGMGGLITRNVIENNNVGIKILHTLDNIYCNKFCNNASYDFQYARNTNTNCVINNYWCTLDSDTIAMHIYDGYDDISLGLVIFEPIDSNQCYLNGCNLHLTPQVTNATCDTCHNGSAWITISNGFAPYSYSWFTSPIQITPTATGLASGTYSVCITDGHGCTACNYNVFVDSTNCTGFGVNATATNATCSLCNDGTATANVTAGTPPFNYTWYTSPIQSTQTATALPAGTYAVCVTDLYGCASCDTVTVAIGSCSSYYTVTATGNPHEYNLTNYASGTPPLTYDWNWGDGSPHDTAAYPTHTYSGAGTYNICLSITDSAGCTSGYCHSFYLLSPMSTTVTVNVIPASSTGITEKPDEKTFSIYPNPASNDLLISMPQLKGNGELALYNVLGEIKYRLAVTEQEMHVDISQLSKGIYFIELSSGNKINRERLVKQ